jgi:heme/copper-type cytochrome/quinol oxidase subunit 2
MITNGRGGISHYPRLFPLRPLLSPGFVTNTRCIIIVEMRHDGVIIIITTQCIWVIIIVIFIVYSHGGRWAEESGSSRSTGRCIIIIILLLVEVVVVVVSAHYKWIFVNKIRMSKTEQPPSPNGCPPIIKKSKRLKKY